MKWNYILFLAQTNKGKMITTKTSTEGSTSKKVAKFLIMTLLLGICVVIEHFTRDLSKKYTLLWFGGKGKERCDNLAHFEFYALGGRYILLFLIIAYVNVPAALSYIFLDCFGVFINGILRMFYFDDRPFWSNPEYTPCFCSVDYGNPSTTGIYAFLIFASFYRSFTYNSKNKVFNYIFFVVCAANIAYIFVIRMLQNIHYLHQLLFGLVIGYYIYFIYYDILEIDFDNKKQFIAIMKRWKEIFVATVLIWSIDTYIHIKLNFAFPEESIIKSIEINCPIVPIFAFDHESYSKSVRVFEFMGCFLGTYAEYVFVFKYDDDKFLRYDVESEKDMYTKTNWMLSLVRFSTFFFIQKYILSNLILSKSNFNEFSKLPLIHSLVFQQSIPLMIHGFAVFFFIKVFNKCLFLTNESVWDAQEKNELVEEKEKMLELPQV